MKLAKELGWSSGLFMVELRRRIEHLKSLMSVTAGWSVLGAAIRSSRGCLCCAPGHIWAFGVTFGRAAVS